jgi:PEP-CTERM motif
MMRKTWKLTGILAFALVFAGAKRARADIVVTDDDQDTVTGEYQYDVELTSGAYLKPGDGLVIYDFPGLITTGPDAPSLTGLPGFNTNFTVVQSLTGNAILAPTSSVNNNPPGNNVDASVADLNSLGPPFSTTADKPLVTNVSIIYNGGSNLGPTADEVGVLTLYTTFKGPNATDNSDSATGSKDSSGPEFTAEVDSGQVTVPVPEPATSVAGLGMAMIALSARWTGRKKV